MATTGIETSSSEATNMPINAFRPAFTRRSPRSFPTAGDLPVLLRTLGLRRSPALLSWRSDLWGPWTCSVGAQRRCVRRLGHCVALSHRHATGHHHSVGQSGPAVPHNRAPADTGKRYGAPLEDKQILPEFFRALIPLEGDAFALD